MVAPRRVQGLVHSCRGEQFDAGGDAVLGARKSNMATVASLPLPTELSFFVP